MGLKKIALAAAFFISSVFAQKKDVVLATLEYPPHYGEHLKNHGAAVEIATKAFAQSGLTVDVLFLPWRRALDWSNQGRIDGMIGAWYTEERSKSFIYSDPIYPNQMVFYQSVNAKINFNSYEDLAAQNIVVGSVRGYAHVKGLDDSGVEIRYVNNDIQNFKLLERGRIDLLAVDKDYAKHVLSTPDLEYMADKVEVINKILDVRQQHVIISKKATEAQTKVALFNQGLKQLEDNNLKAQIMKEHGIED